MLYKIKEKVKCLLEEYASDIIMATAVFLVGMIGFGLGRLSAVMPEKAPLRVIEPSASETSGGNRAGQGSERVVASKSGSAYYFPWCTNSIKEENKVGFASAKEAEDAGYRIAKNCLP